jgi:iron complex outermembrane recepter protein
MQPSFEVAGLVESLARGGGAFMRLTSVIAIICLSTVGVSVAADLQAAMRRPTNIPEQSLDTALQLLAKERDLQMIYSYKIVGTLRTSGVSGDLTFEEALTRLLDGTGLAYRYIDDRTVTIVPAAGEIPSSIGGNSAPIDPVRVAQEDASGRNASGNQSTADSEGSDDASLEEVVVTAQKRVERLIDVPQSVTVLSADNLARSGITQFRDYASTVPGLTFTTQGAGETQISLRGVTAGVDVGPTVGIYVDEVPYGSSTVFGQGVRATLDMGVFDLERIEILRGPQGTLYGASTMGGLLKYVTKLPDASRFGVDAHTGIASTREGDVSYTGSLAINAPIATDKAALRASGFYSHDGGYIDNLQLGHEDVNRSNTYGGRADLLLTPIEPLSIRLTALMQNISRNGEGTADFAFAGGPVDGSLEIRRPLDEPFDQRFRLGSLTATYDLGGAALTAVSSYQTTDRERVREDRANLGTCTFGGLVCSAAGSGSDLSTDKFTQEVRLASDAAETIEWLIGGFYTREKSVHDQQLVLRDLAGEPMPNTLFAISVPSRYEESAAFGDLTWHFNNRFDVTGGVRFAHNRQRHRQFGGGLFGRTSPTVNRSEDDVVTYLANARYHFSDRATGYLRYATGYRPGGPNFVLTDPITGLPTTTLNTFEADRLKSYEIGYKADTADRRLGIDMAVFHIDWSNIQITGVSRGGFGFIANAPGGADVQGAELALTARPMARFTATGSFTYQEAELSEADPILRGRAGERLPNVPRFTASLSADYELPGSWRPTIGATLRHVGDREASFDASTSSRQYQLPEFTSVDLRAGVAFERVETQLYVRNAFDERGQLSALTIQGQPRPAILQPRTIGISLTARF